MNQTLCDWFRDLSPELAFGLLESHWSTELLDHAAGCLSCQNNLDELILIGDRLLLVGPQIAPPADFEARVVARMSPPSGASGGIPGPAAGARSRRVALVAAAAALVGLAVGGGYAIGHRGTVHPEVAAANLTGGRAGAILRPDGTVAGTITLSNRPRPLALVTVDDPRPGAGVVTCELVDANGQATTIGTWSFDQIAGGAWAVGIDPTLLSAQKMNIRSAAGAVLATAILH